MTSTQTSLTVHISRGLDPVNYALIAVSAALAVALIIGTFVIFRKEYTRTKQAKVVHFKEKLNVRRKGISGVSTQRASSIDSFSASEATSCIQLTETSSSVRCSSAWTTSPVTSISIVGTPTSGEFP